MRATHNDHVRASDSQLRNDDDIRVAEELVMLAAAKLRETAGPGTARVSGHVSHEKTYTRAHPLPE